MTKNLFILCGAPASGKSTWAQSFCKAYPSTAWISRDKIRFSLMQPGDNYFSKEKQVYTLLVNEINRCILNPVEYQNIIVDATNINEFSREKLLSKLKLDGVNLYGVYFKPTLTQCIERNASRAGKEYVPEEQVRQFYKNQSPFEKDKRQYSKIYHITR